MRWERLFAEIEGNLAEAEQAERDALAAEMREGEWAETSWVQLLGTDVVLEVAVLGRVEGRVELVNEQVVHLRTASQYLIVGTGSVLAVTDSEGRLSPPSAVARKLSWGHFFRAARSEEDLVLCLRSDGQRIDGQVDAVGRDFVRVRSHSGRLIVLPFHGLVAASINRY